MTRRISRSQLQSQLRQAQQRQQQAINRYNQEVRQYNQGVRQRQQRIQQAVNQYNVAVRAYNARVRTNRSQLEHLIIRLRQAPTSSRLVTYRASVELLHRTYVRLENDFESEAFDPVEARFAALSHRETLNSIEVTNRLLGDEPSHVEVEEPPDSELGDRLRAISPDLDDRWRGAVFALDPRNPDAARHFCTSAREIFTSVLEIHAPATAVMEWSPQCQKTEQGTPTRKSRIRYLLWRRGLIGEAREEFVERDMENIVQLFHVFNDGTHGSAGAYTMPQLTSIKKRVEDGIVFLAELTTGAPGEEDE